MNDGKDETDEFELPRVRGDDDAPGQGGVRPHLSLLRGAIRCEGCGRSVFVSDAGRIHCKDCGRELDPLN